MVLHEEDEPEDRGGEKEDVDAIEDAAAPRSMVPESLTPAPRLIAYPLTLIPLLWKQEDGPALVVFLMVCVWAGDIAALYIGRAFGKRKLAPRLSPGKTWVGSFASIAGSMLAAGLVIYVSDTLTARGNTILHISEPLWQSLLLAAILNIAAQLGDLLESAIKRGAGVKDSGTMLPGHGGILDRIDALLLAAPVLWFILLIKDHFNFSRF